MTDESPQAAELRWARRPLRNYSDAEIQEALAQRMQARRNLTGISADFCQIAIDRLQTELEGRNARWSWVGG